MGTWMGNGYRKFGVFSPTNMDSAKGWLEDFSPRMALRVMTTLKSQWRAIYFGNYVFSPFWACFLDFCFPASLLFSFSAFCYSAFPCFSAFIYSSLLLCFSASPLFCFSLLLCFYSSLLLCFASLLLSLSAFLLFPAFLLFQLLCFLLFPASLLICFSAYLLFPLFSLFLILQIILKKHHIISYRYHIDK